LIWLLVGIVFTLVSVVKWAQKTWKKTKIINVVDDEHRQWEATKEEIKKWLFDDQAVRED
jgi:Fe-S cluster biosynthesis and repair protein YggX